MAYTDNELLNVGFHYFILIDTWVPLPSDIDNTITPITISTQYNNLELDF